MRAEKIKFVRVGLLLFSLGFVFLTACEQRGFLLTDGVVRPVKKMELWNGRDLVGWAVYLQGPEATRSSVWSIEDGIIKCTGKPRVYIRTKQSYKDYKLHLEWRWPGEGGNSGILMHTQGPDKVWPRSVECQLHSGNAGDFWFIGGTDPQGRTEKGAYRQVKIERSSENSLGSWNVAEIYCKGREVKISINGVLQNEIDDSPVISGAICLQSEGTPIEFRNIYIEPVD